MQEEHNSNTVTPEPQTNTTAENTNVNTPEPSANFSPDSSQPPTLPVLPTAPKKSKKKLIIIAISALAAIIIASALYVFVFRKDDAKSPTKNVSTSNSKSTEEAPVAKSTLTAPSLTGPSIYVTYQDQDASNVTKLAALTAGSVGFKAVGENIPATTSLLQLDKSLRAFSVSYVNYKDTNIKSVSASVQDSGGDRKNLYTLNFEPGAKEYTTLYDSKGLSADGSSFVFMERKSDKYSLKRVTLDGKTETLVEDILTQAKKDAPDLVHVLAPDNVSPDGKKVYFHDYGCLECDGGSYPNIISYDIAGKKFAAAYKDAHAAKSGYFQSLSNGKYLISSQSEIGTQGDTSYAKQLTYKSWLDVYDSVSGTSKTIFESNATEHTAAMAGYSNDGKTVYVQKLGLEKGTTDQDYTSTHLTTDAINTSTGAKSTLKLPKLTAGKKLSSVYSVNGTYFYTTINDTDKDYTTYSWDGKAGDGTQLVSGKSFVQFLDFAK